MNISLDSNKDIAMVDGGLPLVTGIEETRQLIDQTLNSFEGDWFLNLDLGLPYFQTILQKSTTVSAVENIYLETIASIRGVLDIETFNLSLNDATRKADISFRVVTSDGLLDYSTSEVA